MCLKILNLLLCQCCVSSNKKKKKKDKNKQSIKQVMRQTKPSDKTKIGWFTISGEKLTYSQIDNKDLTQEYYIPRDFKSEDECVRFKGWKIKEEIGSGSYAKVWEAINIENPDKIVAIKILPFNDNVIQSNKMKQRNWDNFKQELVLLVREKHKNIVEVFDHFIIYESCDKYNCYIVMELAKQGSILKQIIDENHEYNDSLYKPLSEIKVKSYFRDTAFGLQYLHNKNITHKDLKLSNLLVFIDKSGQEMVKIADFGTSRVSYKEDVVKDYKCYGTVDYMSPQIFRIYVYIQIGQKIDVLKKYNPFEADLWSLGVCLYVMICAKIPFLPKDCDSYHEVNQNIKTYKFIYRNMINKRYEISDQTINTYTDQCLDILSQLLHPNSSDRIKIDAVLQHKWLNSQTNDENYEIIT
ncbi:testis-specific serine/threonine-protein kinase 2-like [Oppia nitens]|uniref:testis-specific serine/threonine-protein kinase 2-like n=1 Tax=Oppia nitens TaxID=1686743 RepID=UPI0023DC6CBE|nr:testis-specific serine/threonine-protein kinase 2-like [Oppia nitens]